MSKSIKNVEKFDDYAEITISSKGVEKIMKVDIDNLGYVLSMKNIYLSGRSLNYARCSKGIIHRLIMNCPKGMEVDHINGDGLDNRKSNLRIVTSSINERNIHKFSRNNTGIVGIQYRENGNYRYYRVSCRDFEGKRITKQFNINKYGKELAFEMAKELLFELHERYGYIGNYKS